MSKIKLISVGKTKEKWLEAALDEYIKRLKPTLSIECLFVQNDTQLIQQTLKEKHLLLLDPQGKCMSSEEFADFFQKQLELKGARLVFVIGGPEGIPEELKKKHPLISLSPMTFTHQMTRLILIEQIYRATEIKKGTKYHK